MKVSAEGRAAITSREGRRLVAYQDSVGVWTIGVGHTGRMSPPAVHAGMRITDAQCDEYLAADLAPTEGAINGLHLTLTQNQFDACASLAFNVGVHGFVGSSVVKQLKAGNIEGAADDFLMWEKPTALKARREAERKQFLTPDAHSAPASPPKPAAPAAAAPASSPAAITKENQMNFLTALPSIFSLFETFAPLIPEVEAAVPNVVAAGAKMTSDVKKLDASATFADVQNILTAASVPVEAFVKTIEASKTMTA